MEAQVLDAREELHLHGQGGEDVGILKEAHFPRHLSELGLAAATAQCENHVLHFGRGQHPQIDQDVADLFPFLHVERIAYYGARRRHPSKKGSVNQVSTVPLAVQRAIIVKVIIKAFLNNLNYRIPTWNGWSGRLRFPWSFPGGKNWGWHFFSAPSPSRPCRISSD